MVKKPDILIYGVDDKPPPLLSVVLGLQHVFTMSSTLVLPVVIAREIGVSFGMLQALVCFSMIAAGIATILQSLKKGPVGSGYLCPSLCGPSYLSVSVHAAWIGGLPLMHGMTMVAGAFEVIFSRFFHKLKKLFPSEITGLVVIMVAISLIPLGASKFVGIDYSGDAINTTKLVVAIITLIAMVGINVWSRGKLKLYCVLIGLFIGYLLSIMLGILSTQDLRMFVESPWFDVPGKGIDYFSFAFDWSLVLPFIIVSICASLKTFGNLSTCQKINDTEWTKPDLKNVGKGMFADGISVFLGGFLGGVAVDTSASNVGLSSATSATSRRIAWYAGGIFILLGFLPKLSVIFSIMPDPVMGAIVIFVTCFMFISGLQILFSSKMDLRKTFIIGISFVFGVSAMILPDLYSTVPGWIQPIFTSALTLSTILAVLLNQVFNLGKAKEEPA
ncbi:MAG: purine/pyrimidine permease [Bacteroidales bacterium]|nr:purine/pyrimidine permease [Bacteroidales bacterium]